jgi:hypothetical protein
MAGTSPDSWFQHCSALFNEPLALEAGDDERDLTYEENGGASGSETTHSTGWRAVVPCNRGHYAVSTSKQKLDGKGA